MKTIKINSIARLLLTVLFFAAMINAKVTAQIKDDSITLKTAEKWLKNRAWSNDIKLNVHPSVNAIEFYKQYHANKAVWEKVILFIKEKNLDSLSVGKYPIDGENAYASITQGPSKDLEKAGWESHKKYIDLQYVIKGKEQIGVAAVSSATVTKPYDEAKDGAAYTAEGTYYTAEPGTFFLFFPQDAHRPNIKVAGYDIVKKLVIKIKAVN
jgi:YhcH/YjgK/YiaL family protein